MKNTIYLLLVCAVGVLAISTAAQGQGYDYETVDFPGTADTQVFGINERGDAIGNGFDNVGSFPFVYDSKNGTFTSIAPVAGYDSTALLGIADTGDFAGSVFSDATGIESGVVVDKNGAATVFDHPNAEFFTQARGINNRGLVTGFRDDPDPNIFGVGFIYDPKDGSFIDLIPSLLTIAQGINSRGDVVGSSIFLPGNDPCNTGFPGTTRYAWQRTTDGNITYFTVNGLRSSARGISDSGTIVGFTQDPFTGETKGYVTEIDGTQCQDIAIAEEDLIVFPGQPTTFGQGITNSGVVSGAYVDDAFVTHGFVAAPQ